jgi:hypothetical protein
VDVGVSMAGMRRQEVRDGGLKGGLRGAEKGNERVREGIAADRPGPLGSGRERRRESARARTRAVAGRWGPPVRRRGRAPAQPGWAGWDEMAFSFSMEFLMAFLFYFP